MRRIILMAVVTSVVVMGFAATGAAGGRSLKATLSPAAGSSASGTAVVTLNQGQGEVCFDLTWTNTSAPVTAAHIHRVADNSIAVGLFGPPGGGPATNSGCVTAARDVIKAMRQDPGAYYVNLHTSAFPAGELAGVLSK